MPYQPKSREEGLMLAQERRKARVEKLSQAAAKIFSEGFGASKNRITFEIGCGKGHFLSAYANQFKDELCIGVDLITSRIKDSRLKAERLGLDNAFFEKAEAKEFLDALPKGVLCNKIFIMFPDPWPKKRHFKRRLIQKEFLDMLAQYCSDDAQLFFRTDHNEYFDWAKQLLLENPHWNVLEDCELPFEAVSQFQRILPEFNTLHCRICK